MYRSFIPFLILVWTSPFEASAQNQHSAASCTPEILSRIFRMHPDDIRWNKDLRTRCRVTDQGPVPNCSIHAAGGVLEVYLKKTGVLKANEHLSLDYYDALLLKEQIREILSRKDHVAINDLSGLGRTEDYSYLVSKGIALTRQFELPKLRLTDHNGKVVHLSIRDDEQVRDLIFEKLSNAKNNPEELERLMARFLGDTASVQAIKINAQSVQSLKPSLYIQSRFAAELPRDPKRIISPHFDRIESAIRKSLDAGIPVGISTSKVDAIREAKGSATTFLRNSILDPVIEVGKSGHSFKIIGYHLNQNNQIDWFLAQNAWGKDWGANGTFTLSRQYAQEHGIVFAIYDEEQLARVIEP